LETHRKTSREDEGRNLYAKNTRDGQQPPETRGKTLDRFSFIPKDCEITSPTEFLDLGIPTSRNRRQ
jgi:hypothetical protein